MELVRDNTVTDRPAASGLAFAGFVAVALAAGFVGTLLMGDAMDAWYPALDKPPFNPPSGVFAPVWTTLYVMIGVAAWLGWRQSARDIGRRSIVLFGAQLVLNAAWTGIFFGLRSPEWALAEIVVLLATVVAWIVASWRTERVAAYLLLPYAGWVTFATVLTASIAWLN